MTLHGNGVQFSKKCGRRAGAKYKISLSHILSGNFGPERLVNVIVISQKVYGLTHTLGTFLWFIVSLNFKWFPTYGPEHGKIGKKCIFLFIFIAILICNWSFILFYVFAFFMTRATTLPYKVSRISEWFAGYEPEIMIRKLYQDP